jgi:DNA-damage-inducible protein J
MFLCKSLDFNGLPFELRREIPNAVTIAAMKEAEDIAAGRIQAKSYSSAKEMIDDILSEDAED